LSDRRNRAFLIVLGLLMAAGGGLACCLGAGVFGSARSNRDVFDATVVRWWNEGGWMSFATVVAIGAVLGCFGLVLMAAQLRRDDGRSRVSNFSYPTTAGDRGETSVRAASLSHALEADLERILDVRKALVGLFGRYPRVELRAVIEISDDADLDGVRTHVEEALSVFHTTTGVRPHPAQVTIRFAAVEAERHVA